MSWSLRPAFLSDDLRPCPTLFCASKSSQSSHEHANILGLPAPIPLRIQLRPLHQAPVHDSAQHSPTQAHLLHSCPRLDVNCAHLAVRHTALDIEESQSDRRVDQNRRRRRAIHHDQIRETPTLLHLLDQQTPASQESLHAREGRRVNALVDQPRARHRHDLVASWSQVRDSLHFALHQAFLTKARCHVLELFRARSADAVSLAHDPGAVCVVAPLEAALGVGLVHGAVQHAQHFGGVATAAQDDEKMGRLLWVPAAMADWLAAGRREDEAEAEEQCGCCEGGEDREEEEGEEHGGGVGVGCRKQGS